MFEVPVRAFSNKEIEKNVELRVKRVGMFTKERVVLSDEISPLGSSELINFGPRRDIIEGAVIVADSARMVVTQNPLLVQGLKGRMSGLIKTMTEGAKDSIPERLKEVNRQVFVKLGACPTS